MCFDDKLERAALGLWRDTLQTGTRACFHLGRLEASLNRAFHHDAPIPDIIHMRPHVDQLICRDVYWATRTGEGLLVDVAVQ